MEFEGTFWLNFLGWPPRLLVNTGRPHNNRNAERVECLRSRGDDNERG